MAQKNRARRSTAEMAVMETTLILDDIFLLGIGSCVGVVVGTTTTASHSATNTSSEVL
jgi:chemotaxis receptor (MCP) glutamine deamidase CheD